MFSCVCPPEISATAQSYHDTANQLLLEHSAQERARRLLRTSASRCRHHVNASMLAQFEIIDNHLPKKLVAENQLVDALPVGQKMHRRERTKPQMFFIYGDPSLR